MSYQCMSFSADQHHFYFGDTFEDVEAADFDDDEFQLSLIGDDNVFPLPQSLQGEKVYFWRVDAQHGNQIFKGNVWKFFTV